MVPKPDAQLFELMTSRVQDYAIFLLDPDGRIMSWNAGAAAIKQYSAAEIIGTHFSIFYTPADIARDWPAFEIKRAMMEGRFEDEGWRVRKDGSRFWANVIITALRDDAGTLLAFSKITRDMTQRKAEEESLRQSEERFRLLVEGVQDYAIYMLSPDGIVTSWNLGARRIKGYEASEIIGKHVSRFYAEEDIQKGRPWSELAVARETGRAEDEGWRLRKDGTKFWARVVVTALYDSTGKLHGFAKVTQDLTQRRHSEALETSASNLNDFIAILAHELRNPLAPIRNAVQMQRSAKPGDPIQQKALQIIDRQSSQLARIVDDLIDINRVTRGTFSMTRKLSSLGAIVERAVETARPGIESAGHVLELDVPRETMTVDGDELRLTQALTNILNNAARYTDPGGKIALKVSLVDDHGQQKARIAVSDTGRGIDPSVLNSIFGMFVQGKDPLGRPAAGLGVGLALARSIVELHHGAVEAASEGVGKGAEFTIVLPLVKQPARVEDKALETSARDKKSTAGEPTTVPSTVESIAADAPRYRVLVVDDNADAAAALASLLKTHGHEVLAVNEGTEALTAAEAFHPQIVLLDVGMPGMNGLELARRLRQRNRSPRPLIVAVTGWATPEDELRSREAGFDVHLVKPVEEPELLKLIEAHSQSIH